MHFAAFPGMRPRLRTVTRRAGGLGLAAQIALVVAGLGGVMLAPPAYGPMLLVPITDGTAPALNRAFARQARLVGAGPFPGSVVVVGRRALLLPAMLASGTLVIAAAPGLCGDPADGLAGQTS